jgi:nuclear transport factor 2 (NTF2) superfamily protein
MEKKMDKNSHSWDKMSHEAKELVLHGDNDGRLEQVSKMPVQRNLSKKYAKGDYKSDLAKKLWGYHADRCAMNYCKEFGGKDDKWHKMFTPAHRKEAAAHWESMHKDELKEGFYDAEGNLLTEENRNYTKIFAAILDKKPLVIENIFAEAIKSKVTDLVETRKEELKKVLFKKVDESMADGMTPKPNLDVKLNTSRNIVAPLGKPFKGKKPINNVSNAIHASIHPNDKTGSGDVQ